MYLSALGSGSFCCTALLNALKNSGFTMGRQHSNAQIVWKRDTLIQRMFNCILKVSLAVNQGTEWTQNKRRQWFPYLYGDLYSGHDEMCAVRSPGIDKSSANRANILREGDFAFIIHTRGANHNTLFLQTDRKNIVINLNDLIKYAFNCSKWNKLTIIIKLIKNNRNMVWFCLWQIFTQNSIYY